MSPRNVLDERLEQLGSALRERPSVTDHVMHQLHQSLADGSLVKPTEFVGTAKVRRRWPFVITTVAAVAALAALALFMVPARSVGWEEINRAIKSQKWIRASVSYAEGGRGTIWLSPEHGIWAYKNDDRIEFDDGLHKVAYDYKTGAKQITKRRLSDEDQQRVFPVDFGSKDVLLSGWLFGEKVVEQHRQEVTEGGHKWIEFQLVFWRPVGNGGTLRVDPKTNLPASLVVATPDGKTSVKWTFDYPSSGPGDVYALGAPATATIEDRTPSNEGARALDGMAASRADRRFSPRRGDVLAFGPVTHDSGHELVSRLASRKSVAHRPLSAPPNRRPACRTNHWGEFRRVVREAISDVRSDSQVYLRRRNGLRANPVLDWREADAEWLARFPARRARRFVGRHGCQRFSARPGSARQSVSRSVRHSGLSI